MNSTVIRGMQMNNQWDDSEIAVSPVAWDLYERRIARAESKFRRAERMIVEQYAVQGERFQMMSAARAEFNRAIDSALVSLRASALPREI